VLPKLGWAFIPSLEIISCLKASSHSDEVLPIEAKYGALVLGCIIISPHNKHSFPVDNGYVGVLTVFIISISFPLR